MRARGPHEDHRRPKVLLLLYDSVDGAADDGGGGGGRQWRCALLQRCSTVQWCNAVHSVSERMSTTTDDGMQWYHDG